MHSPERYYNNLHETGTNSIYGLLDRLAGMWDDFRLEEGCAVGLHADTDTHDAPGWNLHPTDGLDTFPLLKLDCGPLIHATSRPDPR